MSEEILPGIYDTTSKFSPVRRFQWQSFSTRRGGYRGQCLKYAGIMTRSISEIVHTDKRYAILKHHAYSYRSGQGYAAGMTYVPTEFELVVVNDGTIEDGGELTVLRTLICGHKWRQGIQYLKNEISTLTTE